MKRILALLALVLLGGNFAWAITVSSSIDNRAVTSTASTAVTTKSTDQTLLLNMITALQKELTELKNKVADQNKLIASLTSKLSQADTDDANNKNDIKKLQAEMLAAKLLVSGLDKSLTTFKNETFANHVHKLIGKAWAMAQNEEAWWVSYIVNPPLAKKWDWSTAADILNKKKTLRRIQYTEGPVSKSDFEKDVASVQ